MNTTINLEGTQTQFTLVNRNPSRNANVTVHSNGHASKVSIKPLESKNFNFQSAA